MIDNRVYRLKFYFENDTEGLSDAISKYPNELFDNFEGNIDWDVYNNLYKKNMTIKEELEFAWSIYEGFIPKFYRIEIINDNTKEVLGFLGKPIRYVEHYRFKFFYKDGTTSISNIKTKKPKDLFFDFDGLMIWDEYSDLYDKNLTTHQILKLAMKVYKNTFKKEYYRIEIINDKTNEVIDYIEE